MKTTSEKLLIRTKSEEIYKRSLKVIPGGVNSPVRSFPGLAQTPIVAKSGLNDSIVDADGNFFIDYCCSWGALIHGHAHPRIVEAASQQIAQGSTFGMTTELEAQLALLVTECMPTVDKVRFVSSGTEATMSAIRLARGFTGRDLIVKFIGNYHGHADVFLVQAGSGLAQFTATACSAGVPHDSIKHTICVPYNDIAMCDALFKKYGNQIAAVILEPIAANMGLVAPSKEFLLFLREETHRYRALLIFDEVITGWRIALGGAAEYFDIQPDLSCFGKIIGGGFPAAAFGGRGEIMDLLAPLGPVYQAGTLSGNPVAMAAGLAAITLCMQKNFYQTLEEKTSLLTRPIQKFIEDYDLDICLHSIGSLFTLFFGKRKIRHMGDVKDCSQKGFNRFFQSLFQKGIYSVPSQFEANFVSAAHTTENLLYTKDCILETLDECRQ